MPFSSKTPTKYPPLWFFYSAPQTSLPPLPSRGTQQKYPSPPPPPPRHGDLRLPHDYLIFSSPFFLPAPRPPPTPRSFPTEPPPRVFSLFPQPLPFLLPSSWFLVPVPPPHAFTPPPAHSGGVLVFPTLVCPTESPTRHSPPARSSLLAENMSLCEERAYRPDYPPSPPVKNEYPPPRLPPPPPLLFPPPPLPPPSPPPSFCSSSPTDCPPHHSPPLNPPAPPPSPSPPPTTFSFSLPPRMPIFSANGISAAMKEMTLTPIFHFTVTGPLF